jgi:hypothetical protein
MIEFETTTRISEARETLWRIYRGRVIFYALVFAAITLALYRFQTGDLARLSLIWGLGWVAIFLFVWGAIILFQGSKMAERSSAHGPLRWTGSDEGFRVESGGSAVTFDWAALAGFIETRRLFLLPLRGKRAYLIVPKRCLSEQQTSELSDLLARNLTNRTQ